MARTFVRQETQVRNSDAYDDTIAPTEAAFETNPTHIETDLNNIRSMLHELRDVRGSNWWSALTAATGFEGGTARGVQDVNQDLHELERKRILKRVRMVGVDVAGGATQLVILGTGDLPNNTTAAVGAVTTQGTVVAAATTFGTASATDVVAGANALQPKNLVRLVDQATGDAPADGSGNEIFGLLQSEDATDGHTITDATTTRVQISYVVRNGTGDGLQLITAGEMNGITFDYAYIERDAFDDCPEEAFLGDDFADAGASSSDRESVYANQGTGVANVTTNSTLDLNSAGLTWSIRDVGDNALITLTEGDAGGTGEFLVGTGADTFNVDSATNDFLNGASFDTGAAGTTINIGTTANQIDSGGALSVLSTAADLNLASGLELNFTDSYRAGSTWSLTDGIALASSSAEWDAFEAAFGEVSLLNAIEQAANSSVHQRVDAVVTANIAADSDASGPANDNNLDTNLGDLSAGTFVSDYDIYVNGILQRNGANAAANEDVYPGTSLANGQLRFEFPLRSTGSTPDVISVVKWV